MDTQALMDIYRKERISPYLQDVGEDFYIEMDSVISELQSHYGRCLEEGDTSRQERVLKELENVKTVIKDLYEIRERKVVLSALNYVRRKGEEIEVENLTEEEREMLDDVISILKKNRDAVLKSGSVRKMKKSSTEQPPEKKDVQAKIESPLMTVRITKALPSIVGADGKIYGAFAEDDIASLPDANARALIKQGVAEQIKL